MKQIINIGSDSLINTAQSILLMEIGKQHLFYGIISQADHQFEQAGFYSAEESDEEDILQMVLEKNQLLYGSFDQTILSYYFPESLLVPEKYYKYEDAQLLLNNLYGIAVDAVIISESIVEWQLYNIYHVPQPIHDALAGYYSSGKYWHAYSATLKNIMNPSDDSASLFVDFKPHSFKALLIKHGVFQLAQIFCYETSEDVVYYLLKVCHQFTVSPQDIEIIIGGMIQHQSGIYIEMQKYFPNVEFISVPDGIRVNDSFQQYPVHFFNALYNIAACVS